MAKQPTTEVYYTLQSHEYQRAVVNARGKRCLNPEKCKLPRHWSGSSEKHFKSVDAAVRFAEDGGEDGPAFRVIKNTVVHSHSTQVVFQAGFDNYDDGY